MKIKTTKSTTPYYCYRYSLLYDSEDDSYFCDYGESVNRVIKHKHRRAYYYVSDGHKIYYKDLYVMYKIYNNMNIMINKALLNMCIDI